MSISCGKGDAYEQLKDVLSEFFEFPNIPCTGIGLVVKGGKNAVLRFHKIDGYIDINPIYAFNSDEWQVKSNMQILKKLNQFVDINYKELTLLKLVCNPDEVISIESHNALVFK